MWTTGLRAIVQRALARDPKQRFVSARAFQSELELWAKPAAADAGRRGCASATTARWSFCCAACATRATFPALSDSVGRIQSMASSETESVGSVTNEILKDVALTNKLLRMVNSAHYARGGNISTVSRAVNSGGLQRHPQHGAEPGAAGAHAGQGPCWPAEGRVFALADGGLHWRRAVSGVQAKAKRPSSAPCSRTWGACWSSFIFPKRPASVRTLVQSAT